MKQQRIRWFGWMSGVALVALAVSTWAGGGPGCGVKREASIDEATITAARANGPAGLEEFLQFHEAELTRSKPPGYLTSALDRICAQRDCRSSRLYWYTDMDRALAAARERNVPVLSLRLLGNLDEEYSCANSRFFRTALYANRAISETLRRDFVLHWESVRPVPLAEIDMGDGRKLTRTLTGNSIHYVLAKDGTPIDALPGLYGPGAFSEWLERVQPVARQFANFPSSRFPVRERYHERRIGEISRVWQAELGRHRSKNPQANTDPQVATWIALQGPREKRFVDAYSAGLVAVTKSGVELPLVADLVDGVPALEAASDLEFWRGIAASYAESARLDDASVAVVADQLAGRASGLDATVRSFEERMALDAVRNELLLHRRIHEWFTGGEVEGDLSALNRRVYDELFLTPMEDEWLGLVPPNVYVALDGNGIAR